MQAGVNVAITTDGTSPKVSFDLFQALRAGADRSTS